VRGRRGYGTLRRMNETDYRSLRWRALARRHPSAFLLGAQLLSLLVFPLLDNAAGGRVVFGAFTALVLLLAVWVVNRTPAINWIAWMIAAPAFALALIAATTGNELLLAWSSLLEALLYLYTAGSLIAYMMSDHRVTSDELFAAGATFTLLAWGFAYLYLVCQFWYPGSFTGAIEPERPRTWIELLFLSVTNLSATGLGDILPLAPQARVLAILEQFCGVGYVAIVVSRLIGLSLLRAGQR
jgi:hypothetical protein